jgi:hypothetical protein
VASPRLTCSAVKTPVETDCGAVDCTAARKGTYLVSGDLIVGNDPSGHGGQKFGPHTYACRPPGTPHGPFKSETGCLLLEFHYYDEK